MLRIDRITKNNIYENSFFIGQHRIRTNSIMPPLFVCPMIIMNRPDYLYPTYYIQSIIIFIAWTLIFICFMIAYQKQNNKSWKD